jgi:hypothetical protein
MWPAIRRTPACPTVRRTRNEYRVPVLGCANGGAWGRFPLATRWGSLRAISLTQWIIWGPGNSCSWAARKLMERAPERVVAGALVPPEFKARTSCRPAPWPLVDARTVAAGHVPDT